MKTLMPSTLLRKAASLLAALCMVFAFALGAFAETTTNQAVMNDTTGVVQLKLSYKDNQGNYHAIQSGSGFLINDSTVVTCNHVVTMTQDTLNLAAETFGTTTDDVLRSSEILVSVMRDVTITASVQTSSNEMDYAVLKLSSQLYDRTYLPIRSSSEVQQTEAAYTLGFPGEVENFQDVNTYTSSDVTITSGQVNKINTIGGVDYIQTSTRITSGNSGCPLVDANGAVIGICQGATGSGFDINYYYAIAIDQLTGTLDSLGIEYTKADGSTPAATEAPAAESTAPVTETAPEVTVDKSELNALVNELKDTDVSGYTDDSASAFSSALSDAQALLNSDAATQAQVDAAYQTLTDANGALEVKSNTMLILIIAIVAVVVVVVIVIIVVLTRKKPEQVTADYPNYPTPAPAPAQAAPAPQAPAGGFDPAVNNIPPAAPQFDAGAGQTSLLNQGAGQTSLLNQGAGETSLLNANYGSLTRVKSGESININNGNFVIGKERARVNYCVADNTAVSRTHAAIVNRAGASYIVDKNATNGTFVNGTRLNPGQEQALKSGDKITLADEEFIFNQ